VSSYTAITVMTPDGAEALDGAELREVFGFEEAGVWEQDEFDSALDGRWFTDHDGRHVNITGRTKWGVGGLQENAQALSERLPHATVEVHEEWDEDDVGGVEVTYEKGRPVRRCVLEWHEVPPEP